MMRTVLAAPRRGLLCLLAMAASLAVLSAVPSSDAAAKEEAPKKELPADLALVPGDAFGFVSIRIADLWNTPSTNQLAEAILKDMPPEMKKSLVELSKTVERFTLVMLPGPKEDRGPQGAAIVVTNKPYDEKQILAFMPQAKEEKIGGKTCYVHAKQAFCLFDKTTFIVGDLDGVAAILNQEGKEGGGALRPALNEAAGTHHVTAGLLPAKIVRLVGVPLPPEAKPFTDLALPESVTSTVDFGKALRKQVRLVYSSEDDAKDAAIVARAVAVLGRRGVPVLRKELEKNKTGSENILKLLDATETGLKTVAIEAKDKTVNVSLIAPIDQATMGLALVEAVKLIQDAANRMTSSNNLHQMSLAMINMADSESGKFPRAAIYSKEGKPLLSWRVAILPYIEQDALYKEFHLDEPWDSDHNKKLLAKMPRVYLKPGSAPGETKTHYRVFHGPGAAFEGSEQLVYPASFTDGTSQTILVVEAEEEVPWTKPDELPFDEKKDLPKLGFKDKHGFMVGMADGSTRYVKKTISKETLKAAITRAAGDLLGDDW